MFSCPSTVSQYNLTWFCLSSRVSKLHTAHGPNLVVCLFLKSHCNIAARTGLSIIFGYFHASEWSSVVVTDTTWITKLKIFTSWPFTKKSLPTPGLDNPLVLCRTRKIWTFQRCVCMETKYKVINHVSCTIYILIILPTCCAASIPIRTSSRDDWPTYVHISLCTLIHWQKSLKLQWSSFKNMAEVNLFHPRLTNRYV